MIQTRIPVNFPGMKFSKPALILSSAGLGLTLAYSQQSNTAAQQKALDVLRQQTAQQATATPAPAASSATPISTASQPSRDQLLADVERLRADGKITEQQYATFKKNIQEQYAGSAPVSQTQALTQKALAQKIQQLKTGMTAPVPAAVAQAPQPQPVVKAAPPAQPKAPAKVAQAAPAPAPKASAAAAAPVVVAAAPAPAQARTPERTNTIPAAAYSTLSPQQEAQAREILRQKIAESNVQTSQPKSAPAAARVVAQPAPAPTPARAAAPIVVAQPRPTAAAPTAVAVASTPAPAPNPAAQAVAQKQLREYQLGIAPGTPELIRIVRVKIAELNGYITADEVSQITLATKFYGPSPWAVAATNPKTEIPFPTKNPEGLVQLDQLNTLYRANLVSPGEYHQQRVKILATL